MLHEYMYIYVLVDVVARYKWRKAINLAIITVAFSIAMILYSCLFVHCIFFFFFFPSYFQFFYSLYWAQMHFIWLIDTNDMSTWPKWHLPSSYMRIYKEHYNQFNDILFYCWPLYSFFVFCSLKIIFTLLLYLSINLFYSFIYLFIFFSAFLHLVSL